MKGDEIKNIVFLCHRLPTHEEFNSLSKFPNVYYIQGEPRKKSDLLRAGIEASDKVVITNISDDKGDGDLCDSGAMYVYYIVFGT